MFRLPFALRGLPPSSPLRRLPPCVGSVGAAGSTPSPRPVDPDKVIFRVSWDGGFVTPETLLGRVPMIAVYADGRVITQGPFSRSILARSCRTSRNGRSLRKPSTV